MLASFFDGAQGLLNWTLDWLNLRADSATADAPLQGARSSALAGTNSLGDQPTRAGSFEQVDRDTLAKQISSWAESAPDPAPVPSLVPAPSSSPSPGLSATDPRLEDRPAELLGALAQVTIDEGSDADLLLQLAVGDANGLSSATLTELGHRLGEDLSAQGAFSPLIQPAVEVSLNPSGTGGLISLSGTVFGGLEAVYLPLSFTLDDQSGGSHAFDLILPLFDTDLL